MRQCRNSSFMLSQMAAVGEVLIVRVDNVMHIYAMALVTDAEAQVWQLMLFWYCTMMRTAE